MENHYCNICGGYLTVWPNRDMAYCGICGKKYTLAQLDEPQDPIENLPQDSALGRCCALAQKALLAGDKEALEQYCDQIQELDPQDYHSFLYRARSLAMRLRRKGALWQEEENQLVCHYLDAYRAAPENMKAIVRDELLDILLFHAGAETFGYGFSLSKVSLLRRWIPEDQLHDFLENLINISFDKVIYQARTFTFGSIFVPGLAEAAIDAFPHDKAGGLCKLLKEKYDVLFDLVTAAKGRGSTPQQEKLIEKAIYLVTEEKKRYDSLAAKRN